MNVTVMKENFYAEESGLKRMDKVNDFRFLITGLHKRADHCNGFRVKNRKLTVGRVSSGFSKDWK